MAESFLAPFDALLESTQNLKKELLGRVQYGNRSYEFPRYVFRGEGSASLSLGLFAVLHGDEPEGGLALATLLKNLSSSPWLARNYELSIYPLCNPTGLEDRTRETRGGWDLNRQFWKNSQISEVCLLEKEISMRNFDGLIALHTDDTANGIYGFVRGQVLSAALLEPALQAGHAHVSRSESKVIDGFPAERGIITQGYEGILSATADVQRPPFEIVFETPGDAPQDRQIAAAEAAVLAIMERYREFIVFAHGL